MEDDGIQYLLNSECNIQHTVILLNQWGAFHWRRGFGSELCSLFAGSFHLASKQAKQFLSSKTEKSIKTLLYPFSLDFFSASWEIDCFSRKKMLLRNTRALIFLFILLKKCHYWYFLFAKMKENKRVPPWAMPRYCR